MFTGLVQAVGTITAIEKGSGGARISVRSEVVRGLSEGDSLAFNGVCLTVTPPNDDQASATAIPETLDRTTLGQLKVGDQVNLEPALRVGDALGGHWVQGHVDGVGEVKEFKPDGDSHRMRVSLPKELARYVVEKGSITIDGVSLTVTDVDAESFAVALVPHTLEATILDQRPVGSAVNLEVDILAKYVERMLGIGGNEKAPLTEAWVRSKGF